MGRSTRIQRLPSVNEDYKMLKLAFAHASRRWRLQRGWTFETFGALQYVCTLGWELAFQRFFGIISLHMFTSGYLSKDTWIMMIVRIIICEDVAFVLGDISISHVFGDIRWHRDTFFGKRAWFHCFVIVGVIFFVRALNILEAVPEDSVILVWLSRPLLLSSSVFTLRTYYFSDDPDRQL